MSAQEGNFRKNTMHGMIMKSTIKIFETSGWKQAKACVRCGRMGNYYDQLVRWIFSMNYTYTDDMIFELYESERKLTIYNPVKER